MCGCSATTNGRCINCNSSYFLGYENLKGVSNQPLATNAPNTNGINCTSNTEYTDVSWNGLILIGKMKIF